MDDSTSQPTSPAPMDSGPPLQPVLEPRGHFPLVMWVLLVANVGVYVVMLVTGVDPLWPTQNDLIAWGGNYPPKTLEGEWWRLVTCMFLHIGAIHLVMNMFAHRSLGQITEMFFGHIGYFLIYAFAGLACSLSTLFDRSVGVSAGASGAIFGVAGALIAGVWKLRHTLVPDFVRAVRSLTIQIGGFMLICVLINRTQTNIQFGNLCHLTGLIVGAISGWILAHPVATSTPQTRLARNAFLLVFGFASTALAWNLVPGELADPRAIEEAYNRVNQTVIRSEDAAHERWITRAISTAEYADILEEEVLPEWDGLAEQFPPIEDFARNLRETMTDLRKVIELRRDATASQIEALRTGSNDAMEASREKLGEAARLMEKLNQSAE